MAVRKMTLLFVAQVNVIIDGHQCSASAREPQTGQHRQSGRRKHRYGVEESRLDRADQFLESLRETRPECCKGSRNFKTNFNLNSWKWIRGIARTSTRRRGQRQGIEAVDSGLKTSHSLFTQRLMSSRTLFLPTE